MAMPIPSAHSCPDTDVLVVGHGPAAQVLAILLAQHGWLTTLADPLSPPASFRRVIGLDALSVRVLANAGISRALTGIGVPGTSLEFGNSVLRFHRVPAVTMFHGHALSAALADRAAHLPNLQVITGQAASLLVDHGRYAEAVIGGETLTSSWVVGCDGEHGFHGTDSWRSGRILLAHPVNLCRGIRDAANLAWKLDLVLRSRAHDALLDSYELERTFPGRLSCGVVHQPGSPHTGLLLPPAVVQSQDLRGPFDDVLGPGFVLLATEDVRSLLGPSRLAFLRDISASVVRLVPGWASPSDGAVADVDNVYLPFLAEAGEMGALVRPDHYLFGTAHKPEELLEVVDDLRAQLFHPRMRPRPIE